MSRGIVLVGVVLSGLCLARSGLAGQDTAGDEVALMRQATLLEAAGDLTGSEEALMAVLAVRPSSAPALLALERILTQQRRLGDLPALVAPALVVESGSALLNQLLLRTLASLERWDDLAAAGTTWIAAAPAVETPYREAARAWENVGEWDRARRVLEDGRRRLGAAALALELGGVYMALDDPERAAEEWERAVADGGAGLGQVRRRLRSLPDGGAAVLPALVGRLLAEPASRDRLMAAVELSVVAGLESSAMEAAGRVTSLLEPDRQGAFLVDLARRADGAGLRRLAHWAYGGLIQADRDGVLPVVRDRYMELAAQLGEGGRAGRGEPDQPGSGRFTGSRRAEAMEIQVLALQDPAAALAAVREYRARHGDDADLDRVAGSVAEELMAAGDGASAARWAAAVRGPRSALVRGRLALDRGERGAARAAFMEAAPALPGTEATSVLALVMLLDRISDDGMVVVAPLVTGSDHQSLGDTLDRLEDGTGGLPAEERAAILGFAAGTAEAHGLVEDARRIRQEVVTRHARSVEAPAALLALARSVGEGGESEARELLERLIVEYPRSALVPQARRELDRLRRSGTMNHSAEGE
jgi:tetratricopeptide (TPR) repeat protein